jgi:chemotaxis protein MotB
MIISKTTVYTYFLSVWILSSCAPIYQCGDAVPEKKPIGKRMKAVVAERDELCGKLSQKETENAALQMELNQRKMQIENLDEEIVGLKKEYSKLQEQSKSTTSSLNDALKTKSEELEAKEALLADREKALKEMQAIIARQDSITQSLNNLVRNALLGFNSDELTVELKNGKVYVSMSDKLLFKSGSANVENKGKDALKVLAAVLEKNSDIDVLVEGHTDNIPIRTAQFKDNWDLSVVRATSIVRILTEEYNISPLRVTASGKGEFMPRASNDTSEGRASNRRTEIILSPKLDELMKMLEAN